MLHKLIYGMIFVLFYLKTFLPTKTYYHEEEFICSAAGADMLLDSLC